MDDPPVAPRGWSARGNQREQLGLRHRLAHLVEELALRILPVLRSHPLPLRLICFMPAMSHPARAGPGLQAFPQDSPNSGGTSNSAHTRLEATGYEGDALSLRWYAKLRLAYELHVYKP